MNLFLLIPLVALLIFILGVLVGSGQVTRAQDKRGRRQADVQRDINEQWQALRSM
jgi:hypothetical protein